ncbi:putative MFS transporter [Aspergillus saccharolyticus JOP 1030-1]|uniref:MFS general substrate transporter n=1 Tax=Aspergillus saccharolyticus JOP 1030-1 TaxID=1450539 RepID=A0A318ZB91_9EURO|nr:MFS general substrate transporter [Aspergillus saccharolyticus JOP 1030-1]PYH44636.1 MFS general substrate transporter [Aspergillus saccharolyticus JOP 1030-1]
MQNMDPFQSQSKGHESVKQERCVGEGHDDEDHQRWVRNLLFKMDCRLLPALSGLFLCSFLDRTNVGNAKILGLEDDINITGHQYDIGLTVFYIMYICSELPSNLVIRKASPQIWLPFLTMMWGIFTMCLGFVRNFAGFVVVRALLGIAEGGLLPGIVLYLSFFYRRNDLALRIGIFYTAASLSGAFGGKRAISLRSSDGRPLILYWRYADIFTNTLKTSSVGVLNYFLLPNSLETAYFLTPEERLYALERVMLDTPSVEHATPEDEREKLKWIEVRRGLLDPRMWMSATAYFSILSGLYSFGLFVMVVAVVSDRLQLRGVVMLFTLPIAIAGYGAIANIHSSSAKYAMTCLMATGLYSSVPCILVWNSNNSAGHYKRATTSAMQLTIANCGGLLATFNYPDQDKPQYHRGHTMIMGLLVFAWLMILINVLYCAKINRDKAQGKYAQYAECHDDRDPAFKMIL